MAYDVWQTCLLVPSLTSTECASWVQAWGSIGAILGAVWISRRQTYSARKLEADKRHLDDLLRTEIIHQLFSEAAALCEEIGPVLTKRNPPPPLYRCVERMLEVEQAFRGLPSFELPGHGVAFGVLQAPKALGDLGAAATACMNAWVDLAGKNDASLPSRVTVEFERAHAHATQLCIGGLLTCTEQVRQLRKLMPVSD